LLSVSTGSEYDWLARARGFLDSAKKLERSRPYAPALKLLTWQAAELALKALQVPHNIGTTHDLRKSMDHLKANRVLDPMAYNLVEDAVVTVTGSESYNELRYPRENKLFWETLTPQEARILVDACETIVTICGVKLDMVSKKAAPERSSV